MRKSIDGLAAVVQQQFHLDPFQPALFLFSGKRCDRIEDITFIGLCTDICVISNVMIARAFLPEVPVIVDASCCAGVTPASHETALQAMAACQVKIER